MGWIGGVALYVTVMDRYGKRVVSCDLTEALPMVESLLRKHGRIFLEESLKPDTSVLIPEEFPFEDAPSVCAIDPLPSGRFKITVDVPIRVKGGNTQNIMLSFSSLVDETAMKKSLQKELHKRIPLNSTALDNYSIWFKEIAKEILVGALEDEDE